jgi:hypothetical protein
LISGKVYRRRRALLWSAIASAVFHLVVLTLLFSAIARIIVPRGAREVIAHTDVITLKKAELPTPAPRKAAPRIRQRESAPATTPRREIAREVPIPALHEPPPHTPTLPTRIERDEAGYAREVAQLNAQNNPHAIPTIDPSSRESSTKSYAFNVPSSGDEHGNGIITPDRSWHERGLDCYYGHYEYTYPDGAMETGNILWPFCYDPGIDPFREPPHPIPFPLPVTGFRLPADAQMPPIERTVYNQWANDNPGSAP